MKKLIFFLSLSLSTFTLTFAQAPQGFNYQAVARNTSGVALISTNVGLEISLRQGSASGTIVYTEAHAVTSNNLGLINLTVGMGTPSMGTFSSIDWSAGPYFIQISMDATGGTTYVLMGTQQLMSVPYALYAANGGTTGATGATGTNGAMGATGATGAAGTNGATGATGTAGTNGATGATGTNGTNGATGATGMAGVNGTNGTNGTNGATGATGTAGTAGATGATGAAGTITKVFTAMPGGGSIDWLIDNVSDYVGGDNSDPVLTLHRGMTYQFVVTGGHPFRISTTVGGVGFPVGVTNNDTGSGTVTFKVPMDAPASIVYYCMAHPGSMFGTINIP